MDKAYDHHKYEESIYKMWEESGAFTPKIDEGKKPFVIILPPPNASGKMHTGNVLMIAIEDILIRWHRMMGEPTLWLPGSDHAGTETQITYERELKKEGKSRFSFDRQTLYDNIWNFVQNNKSLVIGQIRKMGASVDWSRFKFTLDPEITNIVCQTFEKMAADNLVYRGDNMINYCPNCGTTYADIEIEHEERNDPLYYIRYPLVNKKVTEPEYLVVATVRPEPIFIDTHLAVNPEDKKRSVWIGRKVSNPLTGGEMEIIGDEMVDPKFGTGIVKLTPAHDENDFQVAKRHGLPIVSGFTMEGRLNDKAGEFSGLKISEARKVIAERLKDKGLIEKIDESYSHTISLCKAGHVVEPTVLPNWFIKVEQLKKPAWEVVKKGEVRIYPTWRKITYQRWMETMHDWAISRQNVWGIRIPAWYNVDENKEMAVTFINSEGKTEKGTVDKILEAYSMEEINKGLQTLTAPTGSKYQISLTKPGERFLQETNTFDTWFSSGQWPLATLGYPNSDDFKYFYPTSVMETGWEILSKWVSRMIMFGLYLTGKPPFEDVYLHGIVKALDGRKMSKSLGNVINPEEYIEQFGVDALRMGMILGTANGKDFNFPRDKVLGFRNFANKIWNVSRFTLMTYEKYNQPVPYLDKARPIKMLQTDREIIEKLDTLTKNVNRYLGNFRFADAGEAIYNFVWHDLADKYIESVKMRDDENALIVLRHLLINSLKLLHPFMPFVTEAVWAEIKPLRMYPDEMLITAGWPQPLS